LLGVLNKLSDLPKPIFDVIKKICEVAFKGLQENQIVFTLDEIEEMCPDINDIPGAINGFGLLQTVQHYPQELEKLLHLIFFIIPCKSFWQLFMYLIFLMKNSHL